MNVISVPGSLDRQTVDELLDSVAAADEARSLFDARHVRWVDPNGIVALLASGAAAFQRQGGAPRLELPRVRRRRRTERVPGIVRDRTRRHRRGFHCRRWRY